MAHFALLNDQNEVTQVVVIANDSIADENGVEQEHLGVAECERLVGPGRWIQTSYNGTFRHQYGSVGHLYLESEDVFVRPSPFPSWVLDVHYEWQPPIPYPDDREDYLWDEESGGWKVPDSVMPSDQQTAIQELP